MIGDEVPLADNDPHSLTGRLMLRKHFFSQTIKLKVKESTFLQLTSVQVVSDVGHSKPGMHHLEKIDSNLFNMFLVKV